MHGMFRFLTNLFLAVHLCCENREQMGFDTNTLPVTTSIALSITPPRNPRVAPRVTTGSSRPRHCTGTRTGSLSIGGDHGWPIGQDDRAWWRSAAWRIECVVSEDQDGNSRCRPPKPQARSNPEARPRMAATDRQETTASKITGLTWIVERSFAWLGKNLD
jgi:hypothetical protein